MKGFPLRGEAVEEDDVVVAGRFDELSVDLVGLEQRLALGLRQRIERPGPGQRIGRG